MALLLTTTLPAWMPLIEVKGDGKGYSTPEFQRWWQENALVAETGGTAGTDMGALLALKVDKASFSGFSAATGTKSRATFATYTAPTVSAAYVRAELQAAVDHIQILSQRLAALIDDAKT
jgi:hypothetical protein